jgi:hypothetical protein
LSADKIEKAGRILILLAGIVLAIMYFAAAFGRIALTPASMFLTGVVVLLYAIREFSGKTYQQGYKDGIDLVLTGMPDTARKVVEAELEEG